MKIDFKIVYCWFKEECVLKFEDFFVFFVMVKMFFDWLFIGEGYKYMVERFM